MIVAGHLPLIVKDHRTLWLLARDLLSEVVGADSEPGGVDEGRLAMPEGSVDCGAGGPVCGVVGGLTVGVPH